MKVRAFACWTLCLFGLTHALSVFHVGNSLSDQAHGIVDIAVGKGHEHFFGRHMIPGAPLQWLWSHKCEGFREPEALGTCADAILKARPWDAVVMQHRQRSLAQDVSDAKNYMEAAFQANPNCQAYFFQEYPYPREGDYVAKWLGTDPTVEHTQFNTKVRADALSAALPGKKKVLIVPIGDVMYAIFKRIKDGGSFPEVNQPSDLFADADHFNAKGFYLAAVTHYATIYAADPQGSVISGLRHWTGAYSVSQAYAQAIWDVAWEVVRNHDYTGVKGTVQARSAGNLATPATGAAIQVTCDLQGRTRAVGMSPSRAVVVSRGQNGSRVLSVLRN